LKKPVEVITLCKACRICKNIKGCLMQYCLCQHWVQGFQRCDALSATMAQEA